jgi:hypothetical protein
VSERHPSWEKNIDRHFAGKTSPEDEKKMREHLLECDACQEHYERHTALAMFDPKAMSRADRLGSAWGLRTSAPRSAWAWSGWGALGVAVAAACVLLLVLPGDTDDGFVERGGDATAELRIYRVSGGASELVKGAVRSGDELALAVRTPSKRHYLMAFARDEHGHVYWYAPVWTDPARDPSSVEAPQGEKLVELPWSVAHEFDGTKLTIFAVFLSESSTVQSVERELEGRSEIEAQAWLEKRGDVVLRSLPIAR